MKNYQNDSCVNAVVETADMKTFENLKASLNSIRPIFRTVENWNEIRAEAKKTCSPEVICMLDVSGFIVKWLKEKV